MTAIERLKQELAAMDDRALLSVRALRRVLGLLALALPLPGRNVTTEERAGGTLYHVRPAVAGGGSDYPYRVTVTEDQVSVSPGYWDFCGQPTWPTWPGGALLGATTVALSNVPAGTGQWHVYLKAEHSTAMVLTGTPTVIQSSSTLADTDTTTHVRLARADVVGGSFDLVRQMASGSLITLACAGTPPGARQHNTF